VKSAYKLAVTLLTGLCGVSPETVFATEQTSKLYTFSRGKTEPLVEDLPNNLSSDPIFPFNSEEEMQEFIRTGGEPSGTPPQLSSTLSVSIHQVQNSSESQDLEESQEEQTNNDCDNQQYLPLTCVGMIPLHALSNGHNISSVRTKIRREGTAPYQGKDPPPDV
jgi:hypothetical protein